MSDVKSDQMNHERKALQASRSLVFHMTLAYFHTIDRMISLRRKTRSSPVFRSGLSAVGGPVDTLLCERSRMTATPW